MIFYHHGNDLEELEKCWLLLTGKVRGAWFIRCGSSGNIGATAVRLSGTSGSDLTQAKGRSPGRIARSVCQRVQYIVIGSDAT